MIHFFTIVLNGMPFIKYHIEVFKKLRMPWKWHIIEGVADLKYDTGWGLKDGANIPKEFHNNGLSVDGTTEYLMFLLEQNRENVIIYRKPSGEFWNGKIEMIQAPLKNIKEDCLLWQVDSDELWKASDIEKMFHLFKTKPERMSAFFYCYYFFGPKKYIISNNVKSTGEYDWIRVWRFKPGMKWISHEPPVLMNGSNKDLGTVRPFLRRETLKEGVTFQHFAYSTLASVAFKEAYYGYRGVVEYWKSLQSKGGRVEIGGRFPWLEFGTIVDDWDEKKNGELLWRV